MLENNGIIPFNASTRTPMFSSTLGALARVSILEAKPEDLW
jgi:hypothetical protein